MAEDADIRAVEAVVDGAYDAISGAVGKPRDWEAMRALYLPDARLTALRVDEVWQGGVEEYIERTGPFLVDNGFSESTLVNRTQIYGDIAHVWSSYSGDWTEEGGSEGKTRGINSFQLVRQGDGSWRIHSILWQAETDQFPLPADMETAA
jgi:hypothetical protein